MADFDVTAPDGRTFRVTAPDGATQEQALAYAQSQFAKVPNASQADVRGADNAMQPPQKTVLQRAIELSPAHFLATKVLSGVNQAADIAGGAVTDTLAQGGSPRFPILPEVAAAGGTVANMAVGQVPFMAAGGVGGLAAKMPLREGAERLMQSAIKPSVKALKNVGPTGPNAERAITTMLDADQGLTGFGGYNVGRGGIEAMQGRVDALSASITDALKSSGAMIDRNAVASRLQDFIKQIEKTDLAPQKRIAAVEELYNDILANARMPRMLPVEQMQKIKQAIYTRLKDAYGELSSDATQAHKYIARGAKEEISAAVPEVAQLNAKEGELINALELARHRAFVTGNKDIGGLGWLTANPAAFAAFMADRSPLFKSIVARLVNTGSQNAPALGVAAGAAYPQNKSQ